MKRTLPAVVGAVALAMALGACSTPASASADMGANTVVLDVRTPAEYAQGHIDGAELLDFNGGDLVAAIPNLDPETEYLVYCRSGNRSGQAMSLMEQAGFTNVTNLGSLEQAASATGIEVVR